MLPFSYSAEGPVSILELLGLIPAGFALFIVFLVMIRLVYFGLTGGSF